MPRQLIIDCDPGHDDLAAIILATSSPDLQVVALTTVCGNAPLDKVTANALTIAAAFLPDVPVYAGAQTPLLHRYGFPDQFHGKSGMDSAGASLPATDKTMMPNHAALEIIARVRAAPGQITIVALAAMTNLALAFALAPDLPGLIRDVVIMGGGLAGGNVTPAAEFNIWADPEAAQMVMRSGVRLTMFGLNVTETALVDEADHARIAAHPGVNPVADIVRFYMNSYGGPRDETHGPALHDPCPVAWLIDPTLFTLVSAKIDVVTDRGPAYGATFADMNDTSAPHHVAIASDALRLRNLIIDALVQGALTQCHPIPQQETLS